MTFKGPEHSVFVAAGFLSNFPASATLSPPTMHPKIQEWEKQLHAITNRFQSSFGSLSAAELNLKPAPDAWSIAENLDHLIRINESYFPLIKQTRQGTLKLPFISKFAFFTNLLGNLILKSVEPERKKKVKTFAIWEPTPGQPHGEILERFVKHQRDLLNQMKSADDLLQKGSLVSSPANKLIVYKLETAFDILVAHEERHYNQALEVRQNIK